MNKQNFIKHISYPIVSGFLLAVTFNVPSLWFLSLFALVPFLAFLDQPELKTKQVFWSGFLFGLVLFGGVFIFFWQTLPLNWSGIESKIIGILLVFYSWVLLASLLAFSVALWAVASRTLKTNTFLDIFLIPSLWVLLEYLRTWGLWAVYWAPPALIGSHFTIGSLGYIIAANYNLLQFARLGGLYLLSFFVVAINVTLYRLFFAEKQPEKALGTFIRRAAFTVIPLLLLLIFPFQIFIPAKDKDSSKTVAAVLSTRFPAKGSGAEHDEIERLTVIKRLVEEASKNPMGPNIIVLPEHASFLKLLGDTAPDFFDKIFNKKERIVIDSNRVENPKTTEIYSRLVYFDTKTHKETVEYRKQFLVPHAEYLSSVLLFILRDVLGQNEIVESFNQNRTYKKGEGVVVGSVNGYSVGALFCSEIFSPGLHRELIKQGAALLINAASHSAFHDSKILYYQTLNVAKVRAVESNRYFILAGNFVPSFVIDNTGKVVAHSDFTGNKVVYARISMIDKESPYTRHGNWILWVAFFFIFGAFLYHRGKKRSRLV